MRDANVVVGKLDGIERQLDQILRWQERHDARHTAELGVTTSGRVELEHRVTKLEDAVTIRSWIGGVLAALLAALGVGGKVGQG